MLITSPYFSSLHVINRYIFINLMTFLYKIPDTEVNMKKLFCLICLSIIICNSCKFKNNLRKQLTDTILVSDTIQYHHVRINKSDGSILPWFSSDKGESYDTVLMLVWNFWNKMEPDSNGLKYYMNHQVWKPGHDMRGLAETRSIWRFHPGAAYMHIQVILR